MTLDAKSYLHTASLCAKGEYLTSG
jgi:hypothetical protein